MSSVILSLKNISKQYPGVLALDNVSLDVYEGENVASDEKSLAFNLTFQDQNKTLSDEEVMNLFNKAIKEVESKVHGILRDK